MIKLSQILATEISIIKILKRSLILEFCSSTWYSIASNGIYSAYRPKERETLTFYGSEMITFAYHK